MGFKKRPFNQPTYEQQQKEPTRLVIISCEGSVTEPEYFNAIKAKLSRDITSLIEIEIVPKPTTAAEPADVLDNLQRFIETKYDYQKEIDSLWLVCDREKVPARNTGKKGLAAVIPLCKEKGYSIALSNPLFEFWLLLHVTDISTYEQDKLFKNERVNNSRHYIDKELSNKLKGGYSKKSGQFNTDIVSLDNIKRAVEQEALFENDLTKIVDKLGCNVGSLIKRIISF